MSSDVKLEGDSVVIECPAGLQIKGKASVSSDLQVAGAIRASGADLSSNLHVADTVKASRAELADDLQVAGAMKVFRENSRYGPSIVVETDRALTLRVGPVESSGAKIFSREDGLLVFLEDSKPLELFGDIQVSWTEEVKPAKSTDHSGLAGVAVAVEEVKPAKSTDNIGLADVPVAVYEFDSGPLIPRLLIRSFSVKELWHQVQTLEERIKQLEARL